MPIIISGSVTNRTGRVNLSVLLDYLFVPFRPLQQHYELVIERYVRRKILSQKDSRLSLNYREICKKIEERVKDLTNHIKLQLGFEGIFQLAGTIVSLCYANSKTKTRQGFAALFDQENLNLMGIPLTSKEALAVLLAMNMFTFIKAHVSGIVSGHVGNYGWIGRLMILLCIFCSVVPHVMSMTLFFTPALGLFNILHHLQGMQHTL